MFIFLMAVVVAVSADGYYLGWCPRPTHIVTAGGEDADYLRVNACTRCHAAV